MDKSESISKLMTAFAKYQAEQKSVNKDSKNPFLKNKYASLDSIIKDTKENLAKFELSFSQLLSEEGVNTYLFHSSGEYISSGWYKIESQAAKGLSNAQAEGVVVTYAKRYQLGSILGISTDEDTDGQQGNNSSLSDVYKFGSAKDDSLPWVNDDQVSAMIKAISEGKKQDVINSLIKYKWSKKNKELITTELNK